MASQTSVGPQLPLLIWQLTDGSEARGEMPGHEDGGKDAVMVAANDLEAGKEVRRSHVLKRRSFRKALR